MRTRQSGFSAVELMMVSTVLLILVAFAIPSIATAVADVRLRGSASDLSGLLQNARLAAVRTNATYTVRFGLPSGSGAYVDLNNNGAFDTGEPMIQFGGTANQVAAPSGAGGAPKPLDAAGGSLNWTATHGNVSFNPRGLPCDSTQNPCGTNVGYIFYLRDTRAFNTNGWAAVSITAAGRCQVWMWDGTTWRN
ncbi:MAG TPA: prepilin-type N-terminal cleavage/methylation domain-containing protein [Candidatus Acidoferrales bacterium]|nr:prepilin-type N-terminal cleavage/methylation domain-containing protein [Candidatus Acidoferrales bacterium]